MSNLVIITSIIDTPKKPLSYSNTRSIFTRYERFEQTKDTIQSIKKYIPNAKILLVECTAFSVHEQEYFNSNCDYIINLIRNIKEKNYIYSSAKAAGEGTMTISALRYIIVNNIQFRNLFKISGRYFLNNNFNYSLFDNNNNIFKKIDYTSLFTGLYKIHYETINNLLQFLLNNFDRMINAEGYEAIFNDIQKDPNINKNLNIIDTVGLSGRVTVCGTMYNG